MSKISVFILCIQALILRVAYCQVITTGLNSGVGGIGLNGITNYGVNNGLVNSVVGVNGVPDVTAYANLPVTGPFGGSGTGEMAVAGEVQASGQTVVTGQVPVIGSVTFSGMIPASGVVSIAGNCGCGNVA